MKIPQFRLRQCWCQFVDMFCCKLLKSLYEGLGSEYAALLFHTEVRWLSHGRVLIRFFELREKIEVFLEERHCDLFEELGSQEFNQSLAYMSYMMM